MTAKIIDRNVTTLLENPSKTRGDEISLRD